MLCCCSLANSTASFCSVIVIFAWSALPSVVYSEALHEVSIITNIARAGMNCMIRSFAKDNGMNKIHKKDCEMIYGHFYSKAKFKWSYSSGIDAKCYQIE